MTRRIDSRLEAAAGMVRDGAVVADIGTDHGYLICELVGSGKCPGGYACDINSRPLAAAEKSIKLAGLSDKIRVVRSDGLEKLGGLGINDFTILGMGGDLIAEIITRQAWARDDSLRFILQPMTKAERLRRALYSGGFAVEAEKAVVCGRFYYCVMRACYTGEKKDIGELFAWTGLIWHEADEASRHYMRRTASRLQKKADGIRASGKEPGKAAFYAELSESVRRKANV